MHFGGSKRPSEVDVLLFGQRLLGKNQKSELHQRRANFLNRLPREGPRKPQAEDLCADYLELQASVPSGGVLTQEAIQTCVGHSYASAAKLLKLARLSAGMASDAAFARQLKRKFV